MTEDSRRADDEYLEALDGRRPPPDPLRGSAEAWEAVKRWLRPSEPCQP